MKKQLLIVGFILFLYSCKQEEPFVDYRQDVKPEQIIDEQFVVGGRLTLNSNSSRIVRVIQFPPKTKYWVFWVGVGQESKQKFNETIDRIPRNARSVTSNPVIALGLEIISFILTASNSGSDNIDCYFTNFENAQLFLDKERYGVYLSFFNGEQTVNTYRVVQYADTPNTNGKLYMTFQNFKDFRDLDVELKVWTFVEK